MRVTRYKARYFNFSAANGKLSPILSCGYENAMLTSNEYAYTRDK